MRWFTVVTLTLSLGCDRTGGPIISRDTAATTTVGDLSLAPVVFGTNDFFFFPSKTDAEEGYLTVPERYDSSTGRSYRIHYVRFPATGAHRGPPTIYLAGGPGSSGSYSAAGDRYSLFMKLRAAGDVIALDQRGVLFAEPHPVCPGSWSLPLDQPLSEAGLRSASTPFLQRCADSVSGRLDLNAFSTLQSTHDLERLRLALGAESVNLWGISYGTHLALAYMRRYPDRVNRAVLAGVEGPDDTWKLPTRIDRVLQSVDSAIAADPGAHAAVPDFLGALRATLARLEAQPAVTMKDRGGSTRSVTLGPDDLRLAVYSALGEREDLEAKLLERLVPVFRGEYETLAEFALNYRLERGEWVMSLSVDCTAGASAERRREIEQQKTSAVLGDIANLWLRAQCDAWPAADLGEESRAPFRFEKPVLFISGSLDPRTPPENVQALLPGFSRGRHLVIEGGAHDDDLFLSSDAIGDEILRFLEGGEESLTRIVLAPLRFSLP